jgi:hypothetical protein
MAIRPDSRQIYENVNKSSKKIRDCDGTPSEPANFATVAGPNVRFKPVSTSRRRKPFPIAFLVAKLVTFGTLAALGCPGRKIPRLPVLC